MEVPSLGPRGEGWVVLQLLALAAIGAVGFAAPGWPGAARTPLLLAGLAAAAAGGLLGWAGIRALGSSLTAFPRPAEGADLREHGVYARVRHPLYGALLLVALGFALLRSPWALVPWPILLAILLLKSIREERWLASRYESYEDYRRRVRHRFVPYLV